MPPKRSSFKPAACVENSGEHQGKPYQQHFNQGRYNDQNDSSFSAHQNREQLAQIDAEKKNQNSYQSQYAMKEIDRANLALARRIVNVQNRRQSQNLGPAQPILKKEGSAGINRRKKLSKIAAENMRMAERLGNITGSRSIKTCFKRKKKAVVHSSKIVRKPDWQ